jgi:hypothetical protein
MPRILAEAITADFQRAPRADHYGVRWACRRFYAAGPVIKTSPKEGLKA